MPASLYTQVAVRRSVTGRPRERWMFAEQTRPEPDPLGPPWRRAPKGTSNPAPMRAFQRAAGYAIQRTDKVSRALPLATAAEGVLLHHLADNARAQLVALGFTRRQARRLVHEYRAPQGVTPRLVIMDEARNLEVPDGTR